MRCPKCGNEVSQDEAFCGQCGTPTRPLPQRTEMVQAPRSGLLQTYNQNNSPTPEVAPDAYGTSPIPPASAYNPNMPPFQGGSMAPPNQTPIITPSDPRQQTDFYQDGTHLYRRDIPAQDNTALLHKGSFTRLEIRYSLAIHQFLPMQADRTILVIRCSLDLHLHR